jgi:hypothetical protein
VGIEERRLNGVFRFLTRAEPAQAEAEDLARVPLEQVARGVRVGASYGFSGGNGGGPPALSYDPALGV